MEVEEMTRFITAMVLLLLASLALGTTALADRGPTWPPSDGGSTTTSFGAEL